MSKNIKILNQMDLTQSLWVYIVIVVIIIFVLFRYGFILWPTLIVALIIGQISLNIMSPPHQVDSDFESGSSYAIYSLIQFVTPVIVYIYAITWAFRTQRRKYNPHSSCMTCEYDSPVCEEL